ncbi:MAG: NAD(+)/NADH kinase [Phycisphaerales bacterium]|nr:NAD(+)/NADH kinase [Phycisphaerales bacterium]
MTPRIFIIGNASKPRVVEVFHRLSEWLETKGMLVGNDLNGRPETLNAARPDYVIALGGDGTILHAGQAMQHRQVPIIGVNMGKLGYLADFDEAELQQHLEQVLANPNLVSRRMMFDVRIVSSEGEAWEGVALNDCVIRVGAPFRTVGLELQIDDRPLCTLAGDGVILATPTGSTAHNMSCGGPIVEPGVEAIIVTPMGPHSFTHRPVVVSRSSRMCIRTLSQSDGVVTVLDGQRVLQVYPDTRIYVSKSKSFFQLVRNPARRSWDTLITKLKWGQNVT